MDSALKDKRFANIGKDPRFRRVPDSTRKVVVDKRFNSMFSDRKFKLNYTVDKRGKPSTLTSSEQLKKFYEIESDDTDEDEKEGDETDEDADEEEGNDSDEDKLEDEKQKDEDARSYSDKNEDDNEAKPGKAPLLKKSLVEKAKSSSNGFTVSEIQPKVELTDAVKAKLQDLDVDYARGEGVLFSDSSSEEESTDGEDEPDLIHDWGELDNDAEETDTPTYRMAVCNMDWDRIRAVDIMVVLQSFAPQGND